MVVLDLREDESYNPDSTMAGIERGTPNGEPIPPQGIPSEQPSSLEQTQPRKEGVVDRLARLFEERADKRADRYLREAARQLYNDKFIDVPSREEVARRREEERILLKTLTPEEQQQYFREEKLRELKNTRKMSDQIDDLEYHAPDYVAELRQLDPEFMDPLIHALRQRPRWQRREKAFERLTRLRERRAKNHPQGNESHS